MPKVSVIVPIYNCEEYLSNCLNSLINQTLQDIEIICINNGSLDGSLDILKEFSKKDKRIVVVNQVNSGVACARNKGLNMAKGEYIGFVDSDDWVDKEFYQNLYDSAKSSQVDIAAGNILRVFNNKQNKYLIKYKRKKKTDKTKEKYKLAKIPQYNYIWNKIYNRKKIEKINLKFQEGTLYEDILFSHKAIFYLKDFMTVPNSTYYYNENPLSIVNVESEQAVEDRNRECLKVVKFIQDNNIKIDKFDRHIVYKWSEKKTFSIFLIPIWVIRKYFNYKYYYLFGCLNVFSIEFNKRGDK